MAFMKDHFAMFRHFEKLTAATRMQREIADKLGVASKIAEIRATKLGAVDFISTMADNTASVKAASKLGSMDVISKVASIEESALGVISKTSSIIEESMLAMGSERVSLND